MTYLIAKRFDAPGCLAVRTEAGKSLAELVSKLGKNYLEKGVQILTVSDPEVYGEYKPYQVVDSLEKFISQIPQISLFFYDY